MSEVTMNNIDKKKEDMDSKSTLTKALAAGAVLMMRPNLMDRPESQRAPEEAYLELKRMIREKYEQVDVDLLDLGPGSEEGQQAMAKQLEDAGAIDDKVILDQAQTTLELIREERPSALRASEPVEPPAHLQ
jgi:hypothetical protein